MATNDKPASESLARTADPVPGIEQRPDVMRAGDLAGAPQVGGPDVPAAEPPEIKKSDSKATKALKVVQGWILDELHGSPVSADTASLNLVHMAAPTLAAVAADADDKDALSDVVDHHITDLIGRGGPGLQRNSEAAAFLRETVSKLKLKLAAALFS